MAVDVSDLQRLRASILGARVRVRAAILEALDQVGRRIESDAKRRAPANSGRLRSLIAYRVRDPGILEVGLLTAADGEALAYGRIQDLGGRVNARPGGWLAIPLKAVKTKAGVAGIRARDVIESPGQVGVQSTFFGESRRGNLILFGKLGLTGGGRKKTRSFLREAGDGVGPAAREKADIVPLFVLKGSVTLKGNRYLTGSVEDNIPAAASFVARRVLDVFREAS